MRRTVAALLLVLALLPVVACERPADVEFPAGTTMDRLQKAGSIRIGVKSDQPSLGFRNPATSRYEGFDIELAVVVAHELGLRRDQITFVTTTSAVREDYLVSGKVDIVVASYSMNAERQQVVGQAGPYFTTGQQLLVRRADRSRIRGPGAVPASRVCSVTGSTSIETWARLYGREPIAEDTYTQCVRRLLNGSVDAVSTDGAVLLGYVAQLPSKLAVVGSEFSRDEYGIGYPKGDLEFCEFLRAVIARAGQDGRWDKAFEDTLGKAGVPVPQRPALQPCHP